MKKTPDKTGQKQAIEKRDKKGRFMSGITGNPAGRPVGTGKAGKLAKALEEYEAQKGKNFVEHYFDLAFKDSATARDLAGRLYPALKSIEGDMNVQQKILNIIGMEAIDDAGNDD